jgi:hypothetical protein
MACSFPRSRIRPQRCHAHQTRSSNLNQRHLITLLPSDLPPRTQKIYLPKHDRYNRGVCGARRVTALCGRLDLWFQLLTIVRKSHHPSLTAVQTILTGIVRSDKRNVGDHSNGETGLLADLAAVWRSKARRYWSTSPPPALAGSSGGQGSTDVCRDCHTQSSERWKARA